MENETQTKSTIKFVIHVLMTSLAFALVSWSIWVGGNLLLGGFDSKTLQQAGVLLLGGLALSLASASAFYFMTNMRNFAITVSTYRFYRALLGQPHNIRLFIVAYNNAEDEFEVPIRARHINRLGEEVNAQWNAINDWKVWGVRQTHGWTGDARWISGPSTAKVGTDFPIKKKTVAIEDRIA